MSESVKSTPTESSPNSTGSQKMNSGLPMTSRFKLRMPRSGAERSLVLIPPNQTSPPGNSSSKSQASPHSSSRSQMIYKSAPIQTTAPSTDRSICSLPESPVPINSFTSV